MNDPVNVFEFEPLARAKMERTAWDYVQGGSEDEVTLRANRSAFEKIFLRPRYLVDVRQRDLSTLVLGQPISFPLLLAPTAYHRLAHPEGELATARAAGACGTIMILSTFATTSLEDVMRVATSPLWFQLYTYRDRQTTEWLIRRADAAGYRALVVTIDLPILGRRERDLHNNFTLPEGMELSNLVGTGMEQVPKPIDGSALAAYDELLAEGLTWKDIDWMRSITSMPLVLKGVMTAEDAQLAVEYGAAGIIVSNHGGRQLDGAPATIDVLPEIVDAVGGQIEILLDGGVRRGTDVLKAIALGAKAVLIGRPYVWGLAANGEAGVRRVLELLREEFDTALALVGKRSVAEIDASILFSKPHS